MSEINLLSHLPYLLGQVYQRRQRTLEKALLPMGLKESEYRVLLALSTNNGCPVTQLAELTVIDRTTLSRILNGMETRGLVTRAQSPTDLRSFNVHMTKAGNKVFAKTMPTAQHLLLKLTDGVPFDDLQELIRILQSIVSNLDKQDTV